MFDIGWQELFIVAILAIIVIGPKDLPRAVRTVMRAIRKLRGMASEFQSGLDEVAREAELDDIRREANKIAHYDVTREIKEQLDPDGDIEAAAELDSTVRETMMDVTKPADRAPGDGADQGSAAVGAAAKGAGQAVSEAVQEVETAAAETGDAVKGGSANG